MTLLLNFLYANVINKLNKVKIIFVYIDNDCHASLLCTFLIELLFSDVEVHSYLLIYTQEKFKKINIHHFKPFDTLL